MVFIKIYWRTLIAVVIVFLLSVINFSPVPAEIPAFTYNDKIAHILMYAFLTFILALDYHRDTVHKGKHSLFYIALILFPFIYGAAIEYIQERFFSPRTAEFLDWVADVLGIFLGVGAAALWIRKKNKKNQEKNFNPTK